MLYELKNCRDGSPATYRTTVDVTEKDNIITFAFTAEHSSFYCPHQGYNQIHSEGDACEILIGSDPERKVYYEIELSPNGDLMLAEMHNLGVDEKNHPILEIHFVEDCFVTGKVTRTENGYTATMSLDKKFVARDDAEIYFNAYRLETDGGEMDKHLFALIPTMRPKFHAPEHFVFLKDYVG
jgi:hypothetical protein